MKKHYSITQFGDVVDEVDGYMSETIDEMKQIGNYFDTREEAEKVVSLLKRIAIIKSYGCNVSEYINNTVLSIEDYYERNKDEKRICR